MNKYRTFKDMKDTDEERQITCAFIFSYFGKQNNNLKLIDAPPWRYLLL